MVNLNPAHHFGPLDGLAHEAFRGAQSTDDLNNHPRLTDDVEGVRSTVSQLGVVA